MAVRVQALHGVIDPCHSYFCCPVIAVFFHAESLVVPVIHGRGPATGQLVEYNLIHTSKGLRALCVTGRGGVPLVGVPEKIPRQACAISSATATPKNLAHFIAVSVVHLFVRFVRM